MMTETTTRLLTKTTRNGGTLTLDLIESEGRVRLRAEMDGEELTDSTEVFAIEPGRPGHFRNAPAGMAFAFATRRGPVPYVCLTAEEGRPIRDAFEAALERGRRRHMATLDPELRAAIRRYRTSERAHQAEDVRAFDILFRHGF